jgi:hypothetical protein
MTVMKAKETAAKMNIPLLAMLRLEEAQVGEIVEKYVRGGPLINPNEEGGLSIHMRNLLFWYKKHIEKKDFKDYISVDVREEHHFKRYLIHIKLDGLFQLLNQRDLDKSIMASYCL